MVIVSDIGYWVIGNCLEIRLIRTTRSIVISMPEQSKKVLIVEDEEDLREAMVDKLTREGFQVNEAKNGEEGLEVASKEHPDLILLDIVMPKMDGMTMMKKLRETNTWGKEVPIILLTNLSADEEKIIQSIVENEPSYYLVKSDWKIGDVVQKVRETLER